MIDSTPSHPGKITSDLTQDSLNTVAEFEHRFLRERTIADRLGEALAGFMGSFGFIALHVFWFTSWITINLGIIPRVRVFDRYPFGLLDILVGIEVVLLTSFVLMKGNRTGRQSEQRSHLALQMILLIEKETTKTLSMVQSICDRLGLKPEAEDQEAQKLSEKTHLATLARELKQKMPDT